MDQELRALVRAAEVDDGAAAWSRLASALVRAGLPDEAGRALALARSRGAALPELEDRLEPPSTLAFALVDLGPVVRDSVEALAWAADGRLLAAAGGKSVHVVDVASGRTRRLAGAGGAGRGRVVALALDARSARLHVGWSRDDGCSEVVALSLPSGERSGVLRLEAGRSLTGQLAAWGEPGVVHVVTRAGEERRVECLRADGAAREASATGDASPDPVVLGWDGSWARLARGAVVLETGERLPVPDALALGAVELALPTARAVVAFARHSPVLFGERVAGAAVSPAGGFLALRRPDRRDELTLVHLRTSAVRRLSLGRGASALAWSPSGRRLAIGHDDGRVSALEVPAGARMPERQARSRRRPL